MANFVPIFILLLSVCYSNFVLTNANNVDVKSQMEKFQVVPDILTTAPTELVEVKYGAPVQIGAKLTPAQTKKPPVEVRWNADSNAYYTLLMTDPDAPSRKNPIRREWRHWLIGNIAGTDIKSGEILTDYRGPSPPKGSGPHRYVFLVYKQPGKITFDEPRLSSSDTDGRANFSTKKFAEKYHLGDPIAGNLFEAENP